MFKRATVLYQRTVYSIRAVLDAIFAPLLIVVAVMSRCFGSMRIDVGLGPTPIINSPYHKKALALYGYRAEFYVDALWYYTKDYDYAPTLLLRGPLRALIPYWLFMRGCLRYRTVYISFDGGPLRSTAWLYLFEPALLKIAGVKTVVLPFGADVHDLTRAPDRYVVHAYARDYPAHRHLRRRITRKIDLWSEWGDHIVSGCDWILYMPYWDTLMISHFAIDTEKLRAETINTINDECKPLRLLHAPNHRTLKGTEFILRAVEELQTEGLDIDFRLLENAPNSEVLRAIEDADLVVDQLVIGWYAMFSIEAMALSKPCICNIDPALARLYTRAGLIEEDECPLISATPETLKERLRELFLDRSRLRDAAARGRPYVERHHSLEAIGAVFDRIQRVL